MVVEEGKWVLEYLSVRNVPKGKKNRRKGVERYAFTHRKKGNKGGQEPKVKT